MPRIFAAFSLLGLAAAAAYLAAPAAALPHVIVPPDSFINYHASTVHELSQEVTLDPEVRARLARHFHVTPEQMKTYVDSNLVLTRLKTAGSYRVACVRADGSEYWMQERLPAGTPIFASRATGQPILKLACGNPMVGTLPPVKKIMTDQQLYTNPKLAVVPSTLEAPTPEATLLASAITPNYAFSTDALTVPPVVQVGDIIQSLPLRGGGGFPLGYLAGIPVIAGVLGSHGSGTNDGPNIPVIPAVPEVSTLISLGALLTGLGALALRRKQPVQD